MNLEPIEDEYMDAVDMAMAAPDAPTRWSSVTTNYARTLKSLDATPAWELDPKARGTRAGASEKSERRRESKKQHAFIAQLEEGAKETGFDFEVEKSEEKEQKPQQEQKPAREQKQPRQQNQPRPLFKQASPRQHQSSHRQRNGPRLHLSPHHQRNWIMSSDPLQIFHVFHLSIGWI